MLPKISHDRLLMTGLIALTLVEAATHFGQIYPDSPGYIGVTRYFEGKTPNVYPFRLLRPIVPFAAALVNQFFDIRTAFALLNIVLWCVAVGLMFRFAKLLSGRREVAFLASAYFTSSVPILFYGAAVLTDMAGYLFVLVGAFLAIVWDIPRASMRRVVVASGIMAIGLLSRETVGSVFFFILVWAVLSKGSLRKTLVFIAIPIAVSLLWSGIVGVSYIAWASSSAAFQAQHQPMTVWQRILTWFLTVSRAFRPELVLLAFFGLVQLRSSSQLRAHVSILAGIGAFLILAPGVLDYRYSFILFPSVLVLAGTGTQEVSRLITETPILSKLMPQSQNSRRMIALALDLFILILYVIDTNRIALRVWSLPWNPFTDPSVSPNSFVTSLFKS